MTYIGQLQDGKHGEGQLHFPTGCKFHGYHVNDQANGYGELRGQNCFLYRNDGSLVYKGFWKDDQPHGEGVYRFKNGDAYHGDHDDGDYHGVGKFVSKCGTVYHGQWNRGKRSGLANFYDVKTGVITRGRWNSDIMTEYIEHKAASEPQEGTEPIPLRIGFD